MDQVLAVVELRKPLVSGYQHLKHQRAWLVELERRLDPPEIEGQPRPTCQQVKRQVKEFLAQLERHAQVCPRDSAIQVMLYPECAA